MFEQLDSRLERLAFEVRLIWVFFAGTIGSFVFPGYLWSIMFKEATGTNNWLSILIVVTLISLTWSLITWWLFRVCVPHASKWLMIIVRGAVPVLITIVVIGSWARFLNDLPESPVKLSEDGFRTALAVTFSIAMALLTIGPIRASTEAYLGILNPPAKSLDESVSTEAQSTHDGLPS